MSGANTIIPNLLKIDPKARLAAIAAAIDDVTPSYSLSPKIFIWKIYLGKDERLCFVIPSEQADPAELFDLRPRVPVILFDQWKRTMVDAKGLREYKHTPLDDDAVDSMGELSELVGVGFKVALIELPPLLTQQHVFYLSC
jgi:hypothetical protein